MVHTGVMNRTRNRHQPNRPRLRLIRGGLDSHVEITGTTVAVTPLDAPIPALDAVVMEDDTWGVLAADLMLQEGGLDLEDALDAVADFDPHTAGSVLLRASQPLELRAVIHDLDRTPTLQESWVRTALARVFHIADERALDTLAMPLLGTVHGRLEAARAVALVVAALEDRRHDRPRQLWLAVHRQDVPATLALLAAAATA